MTAWHVLGRVGAWTGLDWAPAGVDFGMSFLEFANVC